MSLSLQKFPKTLRVWTIRLVIFVYQIYYFSSLLKTNDGRIMKGYMLLKYVKIIK